MAKSQISIDVSDLKAALSQISEAAERAIHLIDSAITESAYKIDLEVKEKISNSRGTGIISARRVASGSRARGVGRRTLIHQASAPGEPPSTDSGRLVSSIRPVTSFLHAEIGSLESVAKYGGYLEDGTAFMSPRPVFEPTLKENEPLIARKISMAIRQSGLAT